MTSTPATSHHLIWLVSFGLIWLVSFGAASFIKESCALQEDWSPKEQASL